MDANETMVRLDSQNGPDRQYTLLDVVPLLRRTSFRHMVMEQVSDPVLEEWWQTYYEPLDLRMQSEITSSVITKLSKYTSSRVSRRILGQPRSSLDFSSMVRQGKILLVSTASGVVGADISALIGATLLGLFQASLAEQARQQDALRRHFLVLIDEFQVFNGVNYQSMLAELRKYGGSFGLATQSLAYLDRFDRTLRATVLANVDHLFAFDMAGEDARLLHELDGVEEDDITNLDDFQCYVKLSLAGRRLPVFSMRLNAPPCSNSELGQDIRRRSRQRDTRPVGVVDDLLRDAFVRYRLASPPGAGPMARRWGSMGSMGSRVSMQQKTPPQAVDDGSVTRQTPGNESEARVQSPANATRRKKKRGGGGSGSGGGSDSKQPHMRNETTPQIHLMYDQYDHSSASVAQKAQHGQQQEREKEDHDDDEKK